LRIHIIAVFLASTSLSGYVVATDMPFNTVPASAPAPASESASQAPLGITLTVKKIVVLGGEERQLDASHAEPGDILEYRAAYKNSGNTELNELSVTLPLPEHTRFISDSAFPVGYKISTRLAKEIFMPPDAKENTEKTAGKSGVGNNMMPGAGNPYGALRWTIEKLAPGQTVVVGVRVRVDGVAPGDTPRAPLIGQATPSILQ
jgi:uncharacterized repeat protein (TIGR01451 family)